MAARRLPSRSLPPPPPPTTGDLLPRLAHWVFVATALWLVVGILGTALAGSRGEWARARRGLLTILLVVSAYLALLLAISLHQPAHILSPAHSRCFGNLCFQVVAAEEPTSFRPRAPNIYSSPLPDQSQTPDRLLRVRIRVSNLDLTRSQQETGLIAFLVDAQGREWQQVPGLAGVPLSIYVQRRGTVISSPVFRVAPNSSGLRLILRHTGWYTGRLTLGDPESLLHRPEEMSLPPE